MMRLMIRIEKFRGRKGVFVIKRLARSMSLFDIDVSIWLYGFNLELETGYWKGSE